MRQVFSQSYLVTASLLGLKVVFFHLGTLLKLVRLGTVSLHSKISGELKQSFYYYNWNNWNKINKYFVS